MNEKFVGIVVQGGMAIIALTEDGDVYATSSMAYNNNGNVSWKPRWKKIGNIWEDAETCAKRSGSTGDGSR